MSSARLSTSLSVDDERPLSQDAAIEIAAITKNEHFIKPDIVFMSYIYSVLIIAAELPICNVCRSFHIFLDIIRKRREEVDARNALHLVYGVNV